MSKHLFYARKFLNNEDHGGNAFIEAYVNEIETTTRSSTQSVDASFTIADCNRIVSLDFSAYGLEDVNALREKVSRLRRVIVAFEKVLLDQYAEIKK